MKATREAPRPAPADVIVLVLSLEEARLVRALAFVASEPISHSLFEALQKALTESQ